jgi:hypothetical protein
MDPDAIGALDVLVKIAVINERLIDLAFKFRARPGMKGANHGFDIRRTEAGCLVNAFVEAEIDESRSYCWWLEIRFDANGWAIETSILKDQSVGQDIVLAFPQATGETFKEFLEALETSSHDLVESATAFDFSR